MNTFIFVTEPEAEPLQKILGGVIFSHDSNPYDLINHHHRNNHAVMIVVWDNLKWGTGWFTSKVAHVLFSAGFPDNTEMPGTIGLHVWQWDLLHQT